MKNRYYKRSICIVLCVVMICMLIGCTEACTNVLASAKRINEYMQIKIDDARTIVTAQVNQVWHGDEKYEDYMK